MPSPTEKTGGNGPAAGRGVSQETPPSRLFLFAEDLADELGLQGVIAAGIGGLLLCIGGIVQLGVQSALAFMEKFKKG